MKIVENLIDKVTKAKDTFKRIGYLVTKKRPEVLALLKKHAATVNDPSSQVQCIKAPCGNESQVPFDIKNPGQTVKTIFNTIKNNDAFTKDLAVLVAESETKAQKSSSFDGSEDIVIQIAQDLKEAANTISPEEAVAEANLGVKETKQDDAAKMLKYIFIVLVAILLIAVAIKYFKK